MDEKIKLQVTKMIVHKRIHEYLKDYGGKNPLKVEVKEQEISNGIPRKPE